MMAHFGDPADDPLPVSPVKVETKQERGARKAAVAKDTNERRVEAAVVDWDPKLDPAASASDPFKTLFVGRLSYDVDEAKLRREFEQWGPVKSVRIVEDSDTNQPRGYAFVEYNRENDMKTAYKQVGIEASASLGGPTGGWGALCTCSRIYAFSHPRSLTRFSLPSPRPRVPPLSYLDNGLMLSRRILRPRSCYSVSRSRGRLPYWSAQVTSTGMSPGVREVT